VILPDRCGRGAEAVLLRGTLLQLRRVCFFAGAAFFAGAFFLTGAGFFAGAAFFAGAVFFAEVLRFADFRAGAFRNGFATASRIFSPITLIFSRTVGSADVFFDGAVLRERAAMV
jgi:hypothetical protein